MSRYDAILFDFDGVLADTEPVHFASWAEALQPLGIRITWEMFEKYCIGIPDRQVAEFFRKLVDPPLDYAAVWAQKPLKRRLFLTKVKQKPPFSDHVIEFVKSLADYKLAVVSASSRVELEPALEAAGILGCFGAVIGTEDVERTKPAPDPYLRAIELLGVRRGLAVEDSEAGIASATAAGLDVLRIQDPSQTVSLVEARLRSRL